MTPERLRECLVILRWHNATLAEALGCDEHLILAWVAGYEDIPAKVGAWLEALTLVHAETEKLKPASVKGRKLKGILGSKA